MFMLAENLHVPTPSGGNSASGGSLYPKERASLPSSPDDESPINIYAEILVTLLMLLFRLFNLFIWRWRSGYIAQADLELVGSSGPPALVPPHPLQ